MTDQAKKAQMNPYDLAVVRRNSPTAGPKIAPAVRQPYALSSAQRLAKAKIVFRPTKSL